MENTKRRDSILGMILSSFRDIARDPEDDNNSIPKMSDLRAKDWERISDSDKKEILAKSPARIKEIVKGLLDRTKVFATRSKTSFASGASVSKETNIKERGQEEINNDDYEMGR